MKRYLSSLVSAVLILLFTLLSAPVLADGCKLSAQEVQTYTVDASSSEGSLDNTLNPYANEPLFLSPIAIAGEYDVPDLGTSVLALLVDANDFDADIGASGLGSTPSRSRF